MTGLGKPLTLQPKPRKHFYKQVRDPPFTAEVGLYWPRPLNNTTKTAKAVGRSMENSVFLKPKQLWLSKSHKIKKQMVHWQTSTLFVPCTKHKNCNRGSKRKSATADPMFRLPLSHNYATVCNFWHASYIPCRYPKPCYKQT